MDSIERKKVVIILGMHRSGTSCLAGSLQEYGLFLGNVKTDSPYNKKGNRELPEVFNLQEEILNFFEANWSNPPNVILPKCDWIDDRIIEIIEKLSDNNFWGFKDPRTIFTLHLWLPLLAKFDVSLIGTFRHPLAVANSLQKRNNMALEDGLNLWFKYNLKLLDLAKIYDISIINFDWDEEQYKRKIRDFIKNIGFSTKRNCIEHFYDEKLINTVVKNDIELPDYITKCYHDLIQLSNQ